MMNECTQSFLEFCPSDRIYFILISILIFWVGYLVGTNGHWERCKCSRIQKEKIE